MDNPTWRSKSGATNPNGPPKFFGKTPQQEPACFSPFLHSLSEGANTVPSKRESVTPSLMSDSIVTPGTVTRQASLSTEFSRVEYWSGEAFPSPGNLPDPGTKPRSPALQADSYRLSHQGSPQSLLGFSIPALTLPVRSSHSSQGAPVSN